MYIKYVNVCGCVDVCLRACVGVHVYACMWRYFVPVCNMHVHICVLMCMHVSSYADVDLHAWVYKHVQVAMKVGEGVCACVSVCVNVWDSCAQLYRTFATEGQRPVLCPCSSRPPLLERVIRVLFPPASIPLGYPSVSNFLLSSRNSPL